MRPSNSQVKKPVKEPVERALDERFCTYGPLTVFETSEGKFFLGKKLTNKINVERPQFSTVALSKNFDTKQEAEQAKKTIRFP